MKSLLASRRSASRAPAQEVELPLVGRDDTAASAPAPAAVTTDPAAASRAPGEPVETFPAGLYADPETPLNRAVFFDDGRYMCWSNSLVIRGTYETDAGRVITAALGTLDWNSLTGRLCGTRWAFRRLDGPLRDLACGATGRAWVDLEEGLRRHEDEVADAVVELAATCEREPSRAADGKARPHHELVGALAGATPAPCVC